MAARAPRGSLLRRFFAANRSASRWLEARLPQSQVDFFGQYDTIVARHMNARPGQLVVDVGGGKTCRFAQYRDPVRGTRIVAVDVSEDEIRHNRDVDEARIADISKDLPFLPLEADMIVSRSVLEHLTDLEGFVANSARVLRSGGSFIHLVPGRFAPFALLNRAMPARLSKKLLYYFDPHAKGIAGFPAYYDRRYYSALVRLLDARGFDVEDCLPNYYQSSYYAFFFPAYLLSALYEMVARASGRRNLAAYLLIVARKR